MAELLTPEKVFVTDGFPAKTYVDQGGGRPEAELRDGLAQENKIISIVGESKTGKTTLCEKVFATDAGANRIVVTGDLVASASSLWSEVYRQLGAEVTSGFAHHATAETIDLLIKKAIPVIIDDFHYVPRTAQREICQQMKNAAGRGLRFVVLNTPHRSDDPIRSNSDLGGRFFGVDLRFWSEADLEQIGTKGFPQVGLKVADDVVRILAREALRSPQLMQTLCLETCRVLSQDVPYEGQEVTNANFDLQKVKQRTVRSYNYNSQLHYLREGPDERGSPRNIFTFADGATGDVYNALVRALAQDPPFLSLTLDELEARVKQIAPNQKPNVPRTLSYLASLFKDGKPPLEWDSNKKLLTVVDPHFYFYMRFTAA
jgi:hypothetical protein